MDACDGGGSPVMMDLTAGDTPYGGAALCAAGILAILYVPGMPAAALVFGLLLGAAALLGSRPPTA